MAEWGLEPASPPAPKRGLLITSPVQPEPGASESARLGATLSWVTWGPSTLLHLH